MIKEDRYLLSQNIENNYYAKLIERLHNYFEKVIYIDMNSFFLLPDF